MPLPARRLFLLAALAFPGAALPACRAAQGELDRYRITQVHPGEPSILAVVAHPGDEAAFAATLYAAATRLGAACDLFVITNGEAGFRHAGLAERLYGLELTNEAVARAALPAIRRMELLSAATLLAARDVYLLDERDGGYTSDLEAVLGPIGNGAWDAGRVSAALDELLRARRHDFVLVLAPTPETHAHHRAAALLALEAVERLPADQRPVVLAAEISSATRPVVRPSTPPEEPELALSDGDFLLFDRTQPVGADERLTYGIVVAWVIAEHKSQGALQLAATHGDRELFWSFARNPSGADARAAELFRALEPPPVQGPEAPPTR